MNEMMLGDAFIYMAGVRRIHVPYCMDVCDAVELLEAGNTPLALKIAHHVTGNAIADGLCLEGIE